jgi:lipoprotein-anchoring transpeptidase ErfK/SrfK
MGSVTRRHAWLVLLGTAAVAVAACSPSLTAAPTSTATATPTASAGGHLVAAGPPSVTITPSDGSTGVGLDAAIQVVAVNATVGTVTVEENGNDLTLAWTASDGGSQLTYSGGLDLDARYTVSASALSANGGETVANSSFQTITSAKRLLTTVLNLSGGETVGIGMPIELEFNTPIPAADQAGIIAHIGVISSPPQPGGWYWFDNEDVHYRPEDYWQPGTQVTVDADLDGVDAGNGYWGLGDWSTSFTIGPAHVTVVDTVARTMTVYDGVPGENPQLLDSWSTNTGKTGFETIGGTLVVLYHSPVVFMQSCPTFETAAACVPGGSEYYAENVYDDTAVSSDGYFIHAAPWVCGDDAPVCDLWPYGDVNSSHGCINLSTDNAVTYYNWSQVGDVVQVVGSTLEASYTDGEGDWQTPWSQFAQGGQDVPSASVAPAAAPPTNVAEPSASSVAGP